MIFFDLHNISTDVQAVEVANYLVVEAIDVAKSQRSKRRRINVTLAKIEKLIALCQHMKWSEPIEILKSSFTRLEDAKAELDVNLWRI